MFSRPKAKSKTETVPLGHLWRGCRPSTKPSYLYSNQYKGKYIFGGKRSEKAERSQCDKAKKVTRRPEGGERIKGVASKWMWYRPSSWHWILILEGEGARLVLAEIPWEFLLRIRSYLIRISLRFHPANVLVRWVILSTSLKSRFLLSFWVQPHFHLVMLYASTCCGGRP